MQEQEKRLLAAFKLMNAEERDFRVEEFENQTKGRTSRCATLTLIQGGEPTERALGRRLG